MARIDPIARRSHYENAFEDYLGRRGIAYVAVAEVRKSIRGRLGAKAFDYIIYPPGAAPTLIDVKGRKSAGSPGSRGRAWNCWVTRDDVDGLARWEEVFGPEFTSAFVFAYWLPAPRGHSARAEGMASASRAAGPPGDDGDANQHWFCGRLYSFWIVSLADYRAHLKPRSRRWRTVDLPREQFIRLARPLAGVQGAPRRAQPDLPLFRR